MAISSGNRSNLFAAAFICSAVGLTRGATTAPAAIEDVQSLMQNVQSLNHKLNDLMPQGTLGDTARRATVAPKAIPILKEISVDFDQISAARPSAASRLVSSRQQVASMLAALGDTDTIKKMQEMAASSDVNESAQGYGDQLLTRWYVAGKDAAAQTMIVDDLEKLDTANATNSSLTMLTMQMANSAASPSLHTRLQTLALDTMKSPASVAIKRQMDVAAARKAESGSTLGKLVDKPMSIAGNQPDGKPFTTDDWKGKVILVDFWATWCGPCKAELPRTKQIYEQYHSKGLELLGVSNDFQVDALKKFVVDQQMPWPEVVDAAAAADQQWNPITLNFGITGIPTMFLIDKKGIARSVTARDNMETMIPQLLAEQG